MSDINAPKPDLNQLLTDLINRLSSLPEDITKLVTTVQGIGNLLTRQQEDSDSRERRNKDKEDLYTQAEKAKIEKETRKINMVESLLELQKEQIELLKNQPDAFQRLLDQATSKEARKEGQGIAQDYERGQRQNLGANFRGALAENLVEGSGLLSLGNLILKSISGGKLGTSGSESPGSTTSQMKNNQRMLNKNARARFGDLSERTNAYALPNEERESYLANLERKKSLRLSRNKMQQDALSRPGRRGPRRKVNDAIITKDGQVIETDEEDNIFATKSPIGGGQGKPTSLDPTIMDAFENPANAPIVAINLLNDMNKSFKKFMDGGESDASGQPMGGPLSFLSGAGGKMSRLAKKVLIGAAVAAAVVGIGVFIYESIFGKKPENQSSPASSTQGNNTPSNSTGKASGSGGVDTVSGSYNTSSNQSGITKSSVGTSYGSSNLPSLSSLNDISQHQGGVTPYSSGSTYHQGGNTSYSSGSTYHQGGNTSYSSGSTYHQGGNTSYNLNNSPYYHAGTDSSSMGVNFPEGMYEGDPGIVRSVGGDVGGQIGTDQKRSIPGGSSVASKSEVKNLSDLLEKIVNDGRELIQVTRLNVEETKKLGERDDSPVPIAPRNNQIRASQ